MVWHRSSKEGINYGDYMLSKNQCKLNTRVKFTSNEGGYSIGPSNPLAGSEWDCAGFIVEVGGTNNLTVHWDNGTQNTYTRYDLSSINESLISIW